MGFFEKAADKKQVSLQSSTGSQPKTTADKTVEVDHECQPRSKSYYSTFAVSNPLKCIPRNERRLRSGDHSRATKQEKRYNINGGVRTTSINCRPEKSIWRGWCILPNRN